MVGTLWPTCKHTDSSISSSSTTSFWLWHLVLCSHWWLNNFSLSFTIMDCSMLFVPRMLGPNPSNCFTILTILSSTGNCLTLSFWLSRRKSWVSVWIQWDVVSATTNWISLVEFLHYYHHSLTMVLCYTQLGGRTSVVCNTWWMICMEEGLDVLIICHLMIVLGSYYS